VAGGFEEQVGEAQVVTRSYSPEQSAHPRQELLVGERLDQVIVGTGVETFHALLCAAQRRQQQDRHLSSRSKAPAHRDAIKAGKHHVQHDEVEAVVSGAAKSF